MAGVTWDARKFSNHEKNCKIAPKTQAKGQNEISDFFAIFWCKNIIEIPKIFFYPKLKSSWDDENWGGPLTLKIAKNPFFHGKI